MLREFVNGTDENVAIVKGIDIEGVFLN